MPNGDQQTEFVRVGLTDVGALERAQWTLLLEQVRLAIRRERRQPSSALCAWCFAEASIPFPSEKSSGMCPYHFAREIGRLEAKIRARLAEGEAALIQPVREAV